MHEVDAVKTIEQRRLIEAHLSERGQIYADIWKVGVNTALRISDLLSLAMEDVRGLDPTQPALRLKEQKTGKLRKLVVMSVTTVFDGLRFTLIDGHLDRHCMPDDLH